MDLLQSLIVPGTPAHAQWVSSMSHQTGSIMPEANGMQATSDVVQDDSGPLPTHQQSAPNSIPAELEGNVETDEAEDIDQDLLRSLFSDDHNFAPNAGQLSHSGLEPTVRRPKRSQIKNLCFFWYHGQTCHRGVEGSMKGTPCRFLHAFEQGHGKVKVLPFHRKYHKSACALEFCPLKESARKTKPEYEVAKKAEQQEAPTGEQKNETKRCKSTSNKICFFWYHYGSCDLDPETSQNSEKSCPYLHHLAAKHGGVQVIRQYHRFACGLELCPLKHGDEITHKTITASSPKKRKAPIRDWDEPQAGQLIKRRRIVYDEETPEKEDIREIDTYNVTCSEAPDKSKHKTTGTGSENVTKDPMQTCFFWYHGTCKRPKGKMCPMKHELSDPPKMVEPPPGYIHREACDREWCPGDAREEDNSCEKRYFERTLIATNADAMKSERSEQAKEWFLSGFDEC